MKIEMGIFRLHLIVCGTRQISTIPVDIVEYRVFCIQTTD